MSSIGDSIANRAFIGIQKGMIAIARHSIESMTISELRRFRDNLKTAQGMVNEAIRLRQVDKEHRDG